MSPEPNTCEVHGIIFKNINDRFKEISVKLDNVLSKMDTAAKVDATTVADIAHLKKSDGEQWSAINELRILVYKGLGLAAALSILIPKLLKAMGL